MIKWLEKKTKRCPKCSEPIEKNAGCNHMTCRCGHQFCWLCLGPFPNCNCGHFEDESRRAAAALQRQQQPRAAGAFGAFDPFAAAGGDSDDDFGGGGGGLGFGFNFGAGLGGGGRRRRPAPRRGQRRGADDGFPAYDPAAFERAARRRGGGGGHDWGGGQALGSGRRASG